MEAYQDSYMLHSRGIIDAMKKLGNAEDLDVVNARDKECEEMKPTSDEKSKACTGRSVEGRKRQI